MFQPLKKFEETYEVPTNYLIRTPQGWKPIKKIMKTVPYELWYIKLENGDDLTGADTHIVYSLKDGEKTEIYLQDVQIGDLIETSDGYFKCTIQKKLDAPADNMYDVEVDSDEHQFYANNITSHNTTCSALYLLWFAMFELDKTVAILANKEATAKSIIDEVKMAWRELPDWLKPGVEKYDQLEIKFDNGSRIMAGATSEDSFRGESISLLFCLGGETKTKIRNKITGEIKEVSLEELYQSHAIK